MKQNRLNSNKSTTFKITLGVILIIFSFDFLTKVLLYFHFEGFTRYSAIPKLVLELVLMYLFIKNKKRDYWGIFYFFGLIGVVFFNFLTSTDELSVDFFFQKIYNLNKFLYVFLFAEVVLSLEAIKRKEILQYIRNIFIFIGAINGVFMILGMLFDIELLRAYHFTERFGYNGFFVKTSETSYLYILLIITTYYEYIHKKTKGVLCVFFIVVSLLIGTKAIWLFLLLMLIIHFVFHKRKIIRITAIAGMIFASLLGFIFQQQIIRFVVQLFSYGPNLYAEHGFITLLSSRRDLLLQDALGHIQNDWTLVNYLFGGINLLEHGVEFEFVDIFLFFGMIGLFIYLLFVNKIFLATYYGGRKILLFTTLMLVSSLSGNFFLSIVSSVFAFVVFQSMEYWHEKDLQ